MEARELRIGNYINYQGAYREKGLTNFTEHLAGYLFGVSDEWDSIEPIPLTEEWLLKFGFKHDVVENDFYLNGFRLCLEEWGDEKGNEGVGFFYPQRDRGLLDVHVKYVHQIQNIYFFLIEKELQLNVEA